MSISFFSFCGEHFLPFEVSIIFFPCCGEYFVLDLSCSCLQFGFDPNPVFRLIILKDRVISPAVQNESVGQSPLPKFGILTQIL